MTMNDRKDGPSIVPDHDTPAGELLEISKAKHQPCDAEVPPRPAKTTDSLNILLADRRRR